MIIWHHQSTTNGYIGSYHQKYYYYIHMLSSYSSQLVKMVLFIKLLCYTFAHSLCSGDAILDTLQRTRYCNNVNPASQWSLFFPISITTLSLALCIIIAQASTKGTVFRRNISRYRAGLKFNSIFTVVKSWRSCLCLTSIVVQVTGGARVVAAERYFFVNYLVVPSAKTQLNP